MHPQRERPPRSLHASQLAAAERLGVSYVRRSYHRGASIASRDLMDPKQLLAHGF